MERTEASNAYCVNDASESKCLCAGKQRFLCAVYDIECPCFTPREFVMNPFDIKSKDTLNELWRAMAIILPMVYFFAIARVIGQLLTPKTRATPILRFAIEFAIIVLPIVLIVNVVNDIVVYLLLFMSIIAVLLLTDRWNKIETRLYELGGKRPYNLTLLRTTINILTAFCILAVDFASFPIEFRKSRRFGAGLMDTGIGLFVFAMGAVSQPPRKLRDMLRVQRIVLPLLFLGLARTLVIMLIDYHQDEHEYGVHLNAFFTLGFTKLLGTAVSGLARNRTQLIFLGIAVLIVHEITLQTCTSQYVMSVELERNTFFAANREGFCSLPGFVVIYILSMYYGQFLQTRAVLKWNELWQKLKVLSFAVLYLWTLLVACVYTSGVARVTCNLGYVVWTMAIMTTMSLLYLIIFDLILNTIWPINNGRENVGDAEELIKTTTDSYNKQALPALVEAINRNGLVFFLLANVLTGGVNIFLEPSSRTDLESVVILTIYMLLATGVIYIMYHYKLRIA